MTSRRSHQCHRDGCDSEAVWRLYVRFASQGRYDKKLYPLEAESSITVCDRHQSDAVKTFLSDANMTTFANGLEAQNFICPRPDHIKFEFARLPRQRTVIELQTAPAPRPIIRCDRSDCVNPARWQIALKLWNIGQSKSRNKPTQVLTALCVCQRHRNEATVKNVLGNEEKSKLLGQLTERGVPMPDFRMTELEFVEIEQGRKADPVRFAAVGTR